MIKQKLEMKLKMKEDYYKTLKNTLLLLINDIKEAVELDLLLENYTDSLFKIITLFFTINNYKWDIKRLKEKLEFKTLKCCNCGAGIDEEFVYCGSCLDKEI